VYEGRLDKLRAYGFGRLIMLAHPGTSDPNRLLAAAQCVVAEWAADDYYVDEVDLGAYPATVGLDTGLETGAFRGVWTNETTMYVDLEQLFAEFARLLHFGGRYVCITGCSNDVTGGRSKAVSRIDEHYNCNIHPRSAYFRALAKFDLIPLQVLDLTRSTIPYWELRARSELATGIEQAFLQAYREGSFHYLLISADRV